jgi:hypothetical protein
MESHAGFEAVAVMTKKSTVFWNVMPGVELLQATITSQTTVLFSLRTNFHTRFRIIRLVFDLFFILMPASQVNVTEWEAVFA